MKKTTLIITVLLIFAVMLFACRKRIIPSSPGPDNTATATSQALQTASPTASQIYTAMATASQVSSATATSTQTSSAAATQTASQVSSATPTATRVSSSTATPTASNVSTATDTATEVPSSTATSTASQVPSATDTDTPTPTISPTFTQIVSPTITMTPTPVCTAVFGNYNTLVGGSLATNYISAGQYLASASVTLKSLSVYCTGPCQCILAVYAYNVGSPGAVLAETGVVTCVTGWNTFTIPDTTVTSGTNYYLAAITNASGGAPQADNSYSGNDKYVSYLWATAAASGIGTHAGWTFDSSYYCMYASQCN
jgi:hypothetical protein